MPELWARAPDATNRKFRELFAQDGNGVNRKLKELWARDGAGINRKVFSGSVPITFSEYMQYGCYPTFTPQITGQVYKLTVTVFEGYPGNAGARFIMNTSDTVVVGQSGVHVPEIYIHNLDGRTMNFCVEPSSNGTFANYITDISNITGDCVIPAHDFSARTAATGPFTLDLYFARAEGGFSVNGSSFEIDFSKVVWLPTNTNCELK